MFEIICGMIELAHESMDWEMIEQIVKLIRELATTVNCPSNWRDIGERLANKYREQDEIYCEFELVDYEV